MPSPICEILNPITLARTSLTNGYDTTPDTLITIVLSDRTGVESWDLTCIGTDDQLNADTVTAGISIDTTAKTATFTTDDVTRGGAYIFQSVVNDGVDTQGVIKQEYTTTFGIFSIGDGRIRLIAKNQTFEGDAEFGWTVDLNNIIDVWGDHETTAYVSPADITTTGSIEINELIVTESINLDGSLSYSSYGVVDVTIDDAASTYEPAWNENVSVYHCDGYTTSGDRTFTLPTIPLNDPISCFTIINASHQELLVEDFEGPVTTIDGYESYDWYAENIDYNTLTFSVIPATYSTDQKVRIGINSANINYEINWGDGNTTAGSTISGYYEHTYDTIGIYSMSITFDDNDDLDTLSLQRYNSNYSYIGGEIPSFKFFINLRVLYAPDNRFSGTLHSFETCTKLYWLELSGGTISGTLPSFNDCTLLRTFSITGNNFSGTLPSFSNCISLDSFTINGSNFTGTLPSFAACTNLTNFVARSNFTGAMPSFAALTNMLSFQCTGNFSSFPDDIPTNTYYVKIGNIFTGTMPTIHTNLSQLYITGNYSGDLPNYDSHHVEIVNSQRLNPPSSWIHTYNNLTSLHLSAYLTSSDVDNILVTILSEISSIPNLNVIDLRYTNDAPSATGVAAAIAISTYGPRVYHN